jgi:vacuolar protein sorting-associated protein 13A/C
MYLDVTIGRAIGKFFKGTRGDVENYYKRQNLQTSFDTEEALKNRKKQTLFKNPASIALAKLKRVNYKFMMRENGGKLMKLIVEEVNLADFRMKSKLLENKWILFA